MQLKAILSAILGGLGAIVSTLLGGWSTGLTTLVIFMCIDYLTGLAVAGVFHNSKKTKSGSLKSAEGWKGLIKKCVTFLFVIIAYRLDMLVGSTYIKDAVIIGFTVNEFLSIVENAGLMGMPLPNAVTEAVEILKTKATDIGSLKKGE